MYLSHFPFQPRCAILSSRESCQLLNMILENSSFVSFLLVKQLLFFFYDNFPSGSQGKESSCNVETQVRSLGWEDPPWKREWQPTPVFLPGNPTDGGAWQATVHGVAKHWVTSTFTFHCTFNDCIVIFVEKMVLMEPPSWTAIRNPWGLVRAVGKLGTVVVWCSFISSASSHLFLSILTGTSRARPLYFTAGLLQQLAPMPLSYFLSHFFSVIKSDSSS